MARGGAEKIAEAAERVRPDGVLLVVANQGAQRPLELKDVEVVHPEPRHVLLELVGRIERAQDHARLRLAAQASELLLVSLALGLLLARRQALERAPLALEITGDIRQRALRKRHRVDRRLRLSGQGRRPRLELPLEPGTAAERGDLVEGRAVRAPAHA